MYRIGKNKKLALLTEDGLEVVVFNKGQEELAEKVCSLLNKDLDKPADTKVNYFVSRTTPEEINRGLSNRGKCANDILSIVETTSEFFVKVYYKH